MSFIQLKKNLTICKVPYIGLYLPTAISVPTFIYNYGIEFAYLTQSTFTDTIRLSKLVNAGRASTDLSYMSK